MTQQLYLNHCVNGPPVCISFAVILCLSTKFSSLFWCYLYRNTKFECLFHFAALCYTGYKDDNEDTNCLKYVPEAVTFPEAEARCQEMGGALFKIDSEHKFDILTDFIGKFEFSLFYTNIGIITLLM